MSDPAGAGGALSRHQALERNFASFYPQLLGTYQNLVLQLGGASLLGVQAVELLASYVVGTRSLLPDKPALHLALSRGELGFLTRIATALHAASPALAGWFQNAYRGSGFGLQALEAPLTAYAASAAAAQDRQGKLLSWCFRADNWPDCLQLIDGLIRFSTQSPAQLPELLAVLEGHFAQRPWAELKTWLWRGLALAKSGRSEEASAFFALRTRDSRAFLGLHGSLLREEREVLRIYTTSRTGRELSIVSLEISAYQASCSYTDGQSLFLPAEISCFRDNELNRRAFPALAALLTGVINNGTYGFDYGKSELRYQVSQRYGGMLPPLREQLVREYGKRLKTIRERRGNILEAVFHSGRSLVVLETSIEQFFYSFPNPVFCKQLFTLLELSRVQYQLSLRYRGLAQDLERMNRALAAMVPALDGQSPGGLAQTQPASSRDGRAAPGGSTLLFQVLLRSAHQLRLGVAPGVCQENTRVMEPAAGKRAGTLIAGMAEQFARLRDPAARVEDSAEAAFRLYNLFFDALPLASLLGRRDRLLLWHNPLDPELEPAIVAAHTPDLFPQDGGERRQAAVEDEPDFVDLTRMSEQEAEGEELRHDIESRSLRLYPYPEFDCTRQQYLARHCVLHERRVENGDEAWYQEQLARHQALLAKMTKKILSIQPEEVELTRRWFDGDEIHIGDAVDYAVDLARGVGGDDRIYQRKTVNTRSVAMQLLVDASSSTREELPGGRVIDIEKSALALLGAALHRIGDQFSVAAYNSNGPKTVSFFLVKDFQEAWTPRVRGRLSQISPWSANRDGCVIRHATARLRQLDCKTKILLILSDGMPADREYGDSDGSRVVPYALEDTRRAILEARQQGILPFCLTIDREAKDYIGHLYGDYSYSILSDISLLPQRLARLYIRLTR